MQVSQKPTGMSQEGYHLARCVGVIQLGSLYLFNHWKPMVRIEWELPLELRKFDPEKPEQPKILAKEFGASLFGESNLKKILKTWMGENFVNTMIDSFDMRMLLGVPCIIKVRHSYNSSTGKWFEEIDEVHSERADDIVPEQITEPRILELSQENFDLSLFNKLPEFLKKKISGSQEYVRLKNFIELPTFS